MKKENVVILIAVILIFFMLSYSNNSLNFITGKQIQQGSALLNGAFLIMHFDENSWFGANLEVKDSSSSNIHGTSYWNAKIVNDIERSKVGEFDGSQSHIAVQNPDLFDYKGSELSISVWFKINNDELTQGQIISKPWNGNGVYNYRLLYYGDPAGEITTKRKLGFYIVGTSSDGVNKNILLKTRNEVSKDAWHHAIVTIDKKPGDIKLYLDGQEEDSKPNQIDLYINPTGDKNVSLSIGGLYPYLTSNNPISTSFKGLIDEVIFWNRILTPQEVSQIFTQQNMVLGSDAPAEQLPVEPILNMHFDESSWSGANLEVRDSSPNNNHGTSYWNAKIVNDPERSKVGEFDGINSHITVKDYPSSGILKYKGGELTISSWFKIDNEEIQGQIISKPWNDNGGYNYRLFFYQNKISFYMGGLTNFAISTPNTVSKGSWHHAAVTLNQSKSIKLYLDGQQVNQAVHTISDWAHSGGDKNLDFVIGTFLPYKTYNRSNPDFNFKGKIDEIAIWKKTLNPREISNLYGAGQQNNQEDSSIDDSNDNLGSADNQNMDESDNMDFDDSSFSGLDENFNFNQDSSFGLNDQSNSGSDNIALEGETQELERNEMINLSLAESGHTLKVLNFNQTGISVLISSNPQLVNMNINETKEVDVNNDNLADINITFLGISNGKANVKIITLNAYSADPGDTQDYAADLQYMDQLGAQDTNNNLDASNIQDSQNILNCEPNCETNQTEDETEESENKSSKVWFWLMLILLILMFGGLIGFLIYKHAKQNQANNL